LLSLVLQGRQRVGAMVGVVLSVGIDEGVVKSPPTPSYFLFALKV
jgi:hypothetical protein